MKLENQPSTLSDAEKERLVLEGDIAESQFLEFLVHTVENEPNDTIRVLARVRLEGSILPLTKRLISLERNP